MSARIRAASVVALLSVGLLLASCTGQPAPTETVPVVTDPPSSPAPSTESTATPLPDADPTCETIIPADVASDFADLGWTAKSEAFRIGAIEIGDGVQCTWGDYTVATDHVQIFGWAPIEPEVSESAEEALVSDGWRREDAAEGVYVTERADTAIAKDEDGYGITYLFGPGWVKLADTKQGLLLVEWPPAN